jgi:uncharacterized protein YecA (UPF0149 family)
MENEKSFIDWLRLLIGRPHVQQIVGSSRYPRNKPCYCGSGKKYKKCCWLRDEDLKGV